MEKKDRCSWMISNFPRTLKNKIMARAKIEDQTGPEFIEWMFSEFFRKEKKTNDKTT